jgi:hypothetical protein
MKIAEQSLQPDSPMARLCAAASPGTNRAMNGSQVKRMLGLHAKDLKENSKRI